MCCILLPCTMLYSSYMLHLLIDTCQEDAEKLWCESLCQYIEHLCLQKLSLLGTHKYFDGKTSKEINFFNEQHFNFLCMTACYQEKDCWNFCFSKKKFTFSKSVVLLCFTFTISILENKNQQKIVKIEILRTMYYVVNAIILTCNFFLPQHFSVQKMTNFFVKLNQFYLISRQADLEDPN